MMIHTHIYNEMCEALTTLEMDQQNSKVVRVAISRFQPTQVICLRMELSDLIHDTLNLHYLMTLGHLKKT